MVVNVIVAMLALALIPVAYLIFSGICNLSDHERSG